MIKKAIAVEVLMVALLVVYILTPGVPAQPFGGGGGDSFSPSSHTADICGPWCGAVIGWLVGKIADYMASDYYFQLLCTRYSGG